jgi:dipeptide/tripeptide permease
MMALGYAIIGVGSLWNILFPSMSGLFVGMTVFTFGEMFFAPVASAYVSGLAPARMRGRYIGAWALANSLSLMFAPSAGMAVFNRSPAALWIGCAICAGLAAVTILGNGQGKSVFARLVFWPQLK